MWLRITVVALLALSGCTAQREAEDNAPDLAFRAPLHPLTLSAAQISLSSRAPPDA